MPAILSRAVPRISLLLPALLSTAAYAAEPRPIAAGGVVLWVSADGVVHSSGDAESGRGDAGESARAHFEPVAGLREVVSVAVQRDGDEGAAALDRAGRVWVWGREFCPLAATDAECDAADHTPRPLPGLAGIVDLALGSEHLLALNGEGRVFAIGDNQYGQLGVGDTEWRRTATRVASIDDAVAVAAGPQNSYFLRRDGSVWGAGLGWGGMLGPTARSGGLFDGLDEQSVNAEPLRIQGLDAIVAISAGNNFVVARDRDGQAWGWGGNDSAQLGQPASDLGIVAPRKLRGFDAVVDVAAGYDFVVAATQGGEVIAQGGNVYGTLGDRRGELDGERRTIAGIAGIDGARRVFPGHYNAFALRADGGIVGWGANDPIVGGFTPRHDDGTAPPTVLDAAARPAPPSAIVSAGGVSLPIRLERGIDQRSERVRIAIEGREPVVIEVDADHADATARIELPPGAHPYTLDGASVMDDGTVRAIEGRGVVVVGAEPILARFTAAAEARGMAAAFDAVRVALGESFATRTAGRVGFERAGPMAAAALDPASSPPTFPMPTSYRRALEQLGPFALRLGDSPFPTVALHAPDRAPTFAQWLGTVRGTAVDPPRDEVEEELAMSLDVLQADLARHADAPWMQDRVTAVLHGSTLHLVAHAGRCPDGSARERVAAPFEPEIDDETGEERHFAWTESSECDVDLAGLLRSAAGESLIHHYRALGAVFVSPSDPDSLGAGIQRVDDAQQGPLRLRLAQ
jgi:hypothetical protein